MLSRCETCFCECPLIEIGGAALRTPSHFPIELEVLDSASWEKLVLNFNWRLERLHLVEFRGGDEQRGPLVPADTPWWLPPSQASHGFCTPKLLDFLRFFRRQLATLIEVILTAIPWRPEVDSRRTSFPLILGRYNSSHRGNVIRGSDRVGACLSSPTNINFSLWSIVAPGTCSSWQNSSHPFPFRDVTDLWLSFKYIPRIFPINLFFFLPLPRAVFRKACIPVYFSMQFGFFSPLFKGNHSINPFILFN